MTRRWHRRRRRERIAHNKWRRSRRRPRFWPPLVMPVYDGAEVFAGAGDFWSNNAAAQPFTAENMERMRACMREFRTP